MPHWKLPHFPAVPSSSHILNYSPLYGQYTGQLVLAKLRTSGFVGAQFYCSHALADSNKCIQIGRSY